MTRTEYLLVCLAEEGAELAQAATKALRFGLSNGRPGGATTNAQDLAREIVDVITLAEMLANEVDLGRLEDGYDDRKKARVTEGMNSATQCGSLTS